MLVEGTAWDGLGGVKEDLALEEQRLWPGADQRESQKVHGRFWIWGDGRHRTDLGRMDMVSSDEDRSHHPPGYGTLEGTSGCGYRTSQEQAP